MLKPLWSATLAAILLSSVTAMAADPAVKCESGKLKISSKYAACLLKAESKAGVAPFPWTVFLYDAQAIACAALS